MCVITALIVSQLQIHKKFSNSPIKIYVMFIILLMSNMINLIQQVHVTIFL